MTALQQHLTQQGVDLPLGFSDACQGSVHHSPTPLVTRCYDLSSTFKPVADPEQALDPVRLCGVCADNLGVFLLLSEHSGDIEWETQRRFGNAIRDLGRKVLAHREAADG